MVKHEGVGPGVLMSAHEMRRYIGGRVNVRILSF